MAQLRAPGGCPWDREQTNASLLPALLEEAYEVAGAIRVQDDVNLQEELGDLLLVILMEAEIAAEGKRFTIDEVARAAAEKLIRRHPHVFGSSKVTESEGVLRQWEAIKRAEKRDDSSYLASLPEALPALMRAQKAQKKVARVNFDWPDATQTLAKVEEELREVRAAIVADSRAEKEDELGDLLFAVVNLSRKLNLDAETLLQSATDKFVRRFTELERRLQERGGKLGQATLSELNAIWNEIKAERPVISAAR